MTISRRSLIAAIPVMSLVGGRSAFSASSTAWLCDLRGQLAFVDPASHSAIDLGLAEPVSVHRYKPDLILVEDASGREWLLGQNAVFPFPPGMVTALQWQERLKEPWRSYHWQVQRVADEHATTVTIRDRQGQTILEQSFPRRIELAASAISQTRRWTIYFQGNNVASEVTIFDAQSAEIRILELIHHDDLAPYAISIVFDPSERQVAISLSRATAPEPETWVINLVSRSVSRVEENVGTVLGWIPYVWGAGTGIIDLRP